MKIAAIVGARPNFVKIAPIMAALRAHPGLRPRLIHTGQHYDAVMSDAFFRDLDIPEPDVNLKVGSDAGPVQTGEVMVRLHPVLAEDRPDLVLVVGDVNSTLAAAVTAVKMGIPVAHVEAGLRSFDRTMPEEINRILTDQISDYLFTTEPAAAENLDREGIPAARVHHVGNVMIDALFRFKEQAAATGTPAALGLTPRKYAVLTLHRPSNVDDPATLKGLLGAIARIAREVPVVFPVHPRTRERLDAARAGGADGSGLRLVDPLPYLDFVGLVMHATCVLTDSGGIQEETTALGIPCLTLRTNTERPITVTEGTNRIVGTSPERVTDAWDQIRRGHWPAGRLPELWDGRAAERIVSVLATLGRR